MIFSKPTFFYAYSVGSKISREFWVLSVGVRTSIFSSSSSLVQLLMVSVQNRNVAK